MTPEEERYRYLKLKEKQAAAKKKQQTRYEQASGNVGKPKTRYDDAGGEFHDDPKMDRSQSAAIGAVDGLTLGFSDEMVGGEMAVGDKIAQHLRRAGIVDPEPRVSDEIHQPGYLITANGKRLDRKAPSFVPDSGPMPDEDFGDLYRKRRDEARSLKDKSVRDNPKTTLTAELAGGVAVPFGNAAKGAKGASYASSALRFAKAGAPIGAAAALGSSKADLTKGQVGRAAADTALGGVMGAGTSALLGPATENVFGKLSQYLKTSAEENALKAAGVRGGITNAMQKIGYETADETRELGRKALDHNLIPWFGSKDSVWRRAVDKMNQVGPGIDDIYAKADAASTKKIPLAGGIDQGFQGPAGFILEAGGPEVAALKKAAQDEINKASAYGRTHYTAKAEKFLEALSAAEGKSGVNVPASQTKKAPSFLDMRKFLTDANDDVNHAVYTKGADKLHKKVGGAVKGELHNQMEQLVGPDEMEALKSLNSVYSTAAELRPLAANAATREVANSSSGLTGTIQGSEIGASIGGPGGAAAGYVLPKIDTLLSQRLPAGMARGQDAASKILAKVQPLAASASPHVAKLAAFVAASLNADPEQGLAFHQALIIEDPEYAKAAAQ